jgi:biotin carboxylase
VRLLLVTPSDSYRTADFLAAAMVLDLEVVVASDAAPAIPGAWIPVPLHDPVTAATRLTDLVSAVDGVVGTDGAAVAVAAETARRLGLPAASAEALATAGDKHRQRRAAGAAGVRQPPFALIDRPDRDDLLDRLDQDDRNDRPAGLDSWSIFPAVVKPLDRAGGQGVVRVDSPAELLAAIRTVGAIVGPGAPLLVEAFVPGIEVAVDGMVRAGRLEVLAVWDKPDTPSGPTFPETILVSPARLRAPVRARVVALAEAVVAATGLTEGPVHVESKVDGDDVWFLELNPRTIGGLCSRALHPGGMSLEELVIRHALSPSPPPSPASISLSPTAVGAGDGDPGPSGVLMLPVARTGRVGAVRGGDGARAVPGVTDVVFSVGAGQEVVALPAGDRYLGFVFARADTADGVEAALRAAWAAVEVEITAS